MFSGNRDYYLFSVLSVVGGLLSAHLLMHKAGMQLEPGWPCSGPLLRMAENIARKLLPGDHFCFTCLALY